MRRLLLVAAALVALSATGSLPQAQANRPNFVIIQADDLGYGDISPYGQSRFQTPSLDRLAREGIKFTNYYAGSTVCAPSRTTLMTGLHTGHAWIRGNGEVPLRPEDATVAMTLRDAGYRTAVVGKWGLGVTGTDGQPDKKGFEYSFGFLDHRHAHRQYTDHLYRDAQPIDTDVNQDYVNDLFTKEALDFVQRADARPFFLYLNYTVPHAELRAPADALAPFNGKFPERPFVNANADGRATGPDNTSLGYRSQPTPHAAFAGMITRMDRDIGRIVDLVHERGLDRRTMVMFISDNGPSIEGGSDPVFFKSSGGLRGIKRDLYEGGIRVPMIARWTGTIPAGRTSDYAAAHWDLFPTLADAAGAKAPADLDGVSILRALRGQRQPAHEFLYWEFHERGFQQAVRMGQWKAVRLAKDKPLELYNLRSDPFETKEVAAEQPAVIARIETYLKTARTDSSRWPVK
jgi:arylsulfatase A